MKKRSVSLLILGLVCLVSACTTAATPTATTLRRPTFTPLVVKTAAPAATPVPLTAVTKAPGSEQPTLPAYTGADPAQRPLRLVMVQHARCAWNPFWCPVEQGIQDAARQMNV